VRVPDVTSLPRDVLKEVVKTFDNIAKTSLNFQPLYLRYTSRSELQRKIDKVAFKMIGLSWSDDQLNTLYDVIKSELDIMQRILEESGKRGKAKRGKRDEDEDEEGPTSRQKSLTEWIEK
jgi:sugar phosphate isomerase/epimerase